VITGGKSAKKQERKQQKAIRSQQLNEDGVENEYASVLATLLPGALTSQQ
jgi:hypothetical protein